MFVGIMLVLIGGFFLLRNLDIIPFWYGWEEMWPIVIVAIGVSMVADAIFKKTKRRKET